MAAQVKVGGTFLDAIAPWGELAWSTSWPGGCKEASLGAWFPPGQRHPALQRGRLFEVMDGPFTVWSGTLAEPNWREGRFTALGLAYAADTFVALDGSSNATSTPSTAVDTAIAAGWQVTRGTSIPTAAYTAAAEGTNSVSALLDSQADELGQRWGVNGVRVVYMAADPTTPAWHIVPNVVDLGNTDADYASTVLVRYQNTSGVYTTATRTDATAAERFGVKQFSVDATGLGPIDITRAHAIADGILAKGKARLGWTNTIEVSSNELLSSGGVPAGLSMVEAGTLLRVHGIYDDLNYLGGQTYLDVVIGEANYAAGSDVVSLSPVGAVAETLSEFVEEITTLAAEAAA